MTAKPPFSTMPYGLKSYTFEFLTISPVFHNAEAIDTPALPNVASTIHNNSVKGERT